MNKEDIKNNMIPDEIKDICRSCESNIFAQNKGCAFRSLGNEYCDYVLEATKIYLDKQQELERYKNIIDKFDKWLLGEEMMFYKGSDGERLIRYGETKKIWLELKGE